MAKGRMTDEKPDYHGYSQENNVDNTYRHEEAISIHPDMDHVVINLHARDGAQRAIVRINEVIFFLVLAMLLD